MIALVFSPHPLSQGCPCSSPTPPEVFFIVIKVHFFRDGNMKTNKQISSVQSCGIIAIGCVRQKTPPMMEEEKQKVAVTEIRSKIMRAR
jgi:hypothetical protein